MFMCVVNLKLVNKLDLTWKQSFLILVLNFVHNSCSEAVNWSKSKRCLPKCLLATFNNGSHKISLI
jgi:hypothetical protein